MEQNEKATIRAHYTCGTRASVQAIFISCVPEVISLYCADVLHATLKLEEYWYEVHDTKPHVQSEDIRYINISENGRLNIDIKFSVKQPQTNKLSELCEK